MNKIEVISQEKKTTPYMTHYGWAVDTFWSVISCHIDRELVDVKHVNLSISGSIEGYYGETPHSLVKNIKGLKGAM